MAKLTISQRQLKRAQHQTVVRRESLSWAGVIGWILAMLLAIGGWQLALYGMRKHRGLATELSERRAANQAQLQAQVSDREATRQALTEQLAALNARDAQSGPARILKLQLDSANKRIAHDEAEIAALEAQYREFAKANQVPYATIDELIAAYNAYMRAIALNRQAAPPPEQSAEPPPTAPTGHQEGAFTSDQLGWSPSRFPIKGGEAYDQIIVRFSWDDTQQRRLDSLTSRRNEDMHQFDTTNAQSMARWREKKALATSEGERAKCQAEIDRILARREIMLSTYDRQLMQIMTADQRQFWFADRIWALMNSKFGRYLSPEKVIAAKAICFDEARGRGGMVEGAEVSPNEVRVVQATSRIGHNVLGDAEYRQVQDEARMERARENKRKSDMPAISGQAGGTSTGDTP